MPLPSYIKRTASKSVSKVLLPMRIFEGVWRKGDSFAYAVSCISMLLLPEVGGKVSLLAVIPAALLYTYFSRQGLHGESDVASYTTLLQHPLLSCSHPQPPSLQASKLDALVYNTRITNLTSSGAWSRLVSTTHQSSPSLPTNILSRGMICEFPPAVSHAVASY